MTNIWEEIKEQIRAIIPEKSFSLWINPLTLLEQREDALVLGCPNKFSLNWVTENYIPLFQENLDRMGERNCRLALRVVSPSSAPPPALVQDPRQLTLPNMPSNGNGGTRALNQDFTFDRFVVGGCNEFAYAASKALAIEGQFPCSSLFIVAKTGLGKSHLSQATAHALLESNPRIKVIYLTAEDFVNEMIFALKNHRIDEFKNKYRRSCDVLLLEEIHFLSGKEKTQLELGYTLDALANDRKRIIFTSSLLPKDIPHLNKELASRLTSGIITTLDTPDYETRVKIIERKSLEHGLALPHEIFHLLAKDLTGDIRQMESALRCLEGKGRSHERPNRPGPGKRSPPVPRAHTETSDPGRREGHGVPVFQDRPGLAGIQIQKEDPRLPTKCLRLPLPATHGQNRGRNRPVSESKPLDRALRFRGH